MSKTAQDSAATQALLERIDQKATGRLTVGAGAATLSVYLMNGSLAAAESPDDEHVLTHLLARQGVLRRKIVHQMEATLASGESVFGELLKYAGPAIDTPLTRRFENNLARFVGTDETPEWEELRGVFVDNLQMGLDSDAVVGQACTQWDTASSLDLDVVVVNGHVPFDDDDQIWIAKAVGKGERPIGAILHDLPMEEIHARIEILDMLAKGMIAVSGEAEADEDQPTETRDLDEDEEDEAIEDMETVFGVDVSEVAKAALEDDDDDDDEEEIELETIDEPEDDPSNVDTIVDAPPVNLPGGTSKPGNLDEWMEQMSNVDEDELDFFRDHDHDRGSGDQGAFSTESHNLDRVEVIGMGDDDLEVDSDEDEILEVEDAGQVTAFGAPVLGENEALEKIDVVNDALAHVVHAFDQAEGAGKGRSVIQLLVDGSPAKYSVLFQNVTVDDVGSLPHDDVVENLWARPATEHRQLINNALVDIVDRALSSAADELPDELFDSMYEAIAGYRQRLGL